MTGEATNCSTENKDPKAPPRRTISILGGLLINPVPDADDDDESLSPIMVWNSVSRERDQARSDD